MAWKVLASSPVGSHLRDAPLSSGHGGEATETHWLSLQSQCPKDYKQAKAHKKKKIFSDQNMIFHVALKKKKITKVG